MDATIGSALDIFGGTLLYDDVPWLELGHVSCHGSCPLAHPGPGESMTIADHGTCELWHKKVLCQMKFQCCCMGLYYLDLLGLLGIIELYHLHVPSCISSCSILYLYVGEAKQWH